MTEQKKVAVIDSTSFALAAANLNKGLNAIGTKLVEGVTAAIKNSTFPKAVNLHENMGRLLMAARQTGKTRITGQIARYELAKTLAGKRRLKRWNKRQRKKYFQRWEHGE